MSNEGEKVQRGGGQLITQEEKNAKIAATDASKQMWSHNQQCGICSGGGGGGKVSLQEQRGHD